MGKGKGDRSGGISEMEKPATPADKTVQFGEDGILKLMVRYSLPAIVAMFALSAHGVINMTFVGRSIGPLGIAAIAICMPVTMVSGSLLQFVSNGCAAAVAIALGKGDKEEAQGILGCSVLANYITSVICIILGFRYMDFLLRLFGASDATLPLSREYLGVSLFAMMFNSISTMNPMLRIEGYPKQAMLTMVVMSILNIILTPFFIFVLHLGIRGAALGSLIAGVVSMIWIFTFLTRKNRTVRLQWRYMRLRVKTLLYVMQLGMPTFLMQITQNLLSLVMNNGLRTYGGDLAISAWGVTNNISNLVSQPIFGMNQGAQPIIGYNYGAKKYRRVKQALFQSLAAATIFATLGWFLTVFFAKPIFTFFNDDPELIAIGSRMLMIFRSLILITGFQQAGAAYFQNTGKPTTSILLTLTRQVFFLIPLLLILPRFFQFDGILYSGPISDAVSALITGVFILIEIRRLNKLVREEEAADG